VVNTLDPQLSEWIRKKLTFLNKYRKGIKNTFQTPYSSGALEGTNNKNRSYQTHRLWLP